ncbi:MAG: glutamate decarboxylase [Solirubrobacteraceae bacterium]
MPLSARHPQRRRNRKVTLPAYALTDAELSIDRLTDAGLGLDAAYELIRSELLLDGQARLNLATFVTTWMPSHGGRLMAETADKNMIDKDEYPQTAEIESRCVNILADLWGSPEHEHATGCSTTGSSEAAMLAGMALKWRWRARMQAAGRPAAQPNLVMGSNVQVCWEKFCRYWEVEPRLVPMEGETFHLTPERAVAHCDENTIGVVAILGSTFDGSYEPVAEIAAALDRLQSEHGIDVPMHVDAASGGFVAPFVDPNLKWDFRLPRVQSINSSGHKYGLVYPGVGWAVWRDRAALPEDLIFKVNYLGGEMPTFALNFSRPGSEVIAQYFMLISLGREGYAAMMRNLREIATHISRGVAELGPYRLISRGDELPVFAFALKPEVTNYTVFDVSAKLREGGWLVPAYSFPENRQDLSVLRVVVRAGMNIEMADHLLDLLRRQTEALEALPAPLPAPDESRATAFAH